MFLYIDLYFTPVKELLFHFLLHAEHTVFVDQVLGVKTDFEPCALVIGGKALYDCIFKIIPEILSDFQSRKNVKKRFGHESTAP